MDSYNGENYGGLNYKKEGGVKMVVTNWNLNCANSGTLQLVKAAYCGDILLEYFCSVT